MLYHKRVFTGKDIINLFKVLSHEIRSPTAVIKGAVDLIKRSPPDSKVFKDSVEMIERNAFHLFEVIDQLFYKAKFLHDDFEFGFDTIDFSLMTEELFQSIEILYKQKNQAFAFTVEKNLFTHGDSIWLKQAINNILVNALKFTPVGGKISGHVRSEENKIFFLVDDNGIGIDEKKIDRVCQPFWKQNSKVGLGMGLHLVKTIVEKHGGSIIIKSDGKGKGSQIGFVLKKMT